MHSCLIAVHAQEESISVCLGHMCLGLVFVHNNGLSFFFFFFSDES